MRASPRTQFLLLQTLLLITYGTFFITVIETANCKLRWCAGFWRFGTPAKAGPSRLVNGLIQDWRLICVLSPRGYIWFDYGWEKSKWLERFWLRTDSHREEKGYWETCISRLLYALHFLLSEWQGEVLRASLSHSRFNLFLQQGIGMMYVVSGLPST